MAPTMVETIVDSPSASFKPIIQNTTTKSSEGPQVFDAKKHLAYKAPSSILKMTDIGYPEDIGISPVAVSQPFPLFSKEAVEQMRAEFLDPEVMENFKFKSNIAACQLRGYATKHGPTGTFTHNAWHSPEVLEIVSKIAGIDLVPVMDYDIGHINFSVKSEEETRKELDTINQQKKFFDDDEGIAGCPWEDDSPVVGWHTDSYPFVCVLMMSDCTNMVGGETALKKADGSVLKVRGPEMGCAVVLQGRYITHQALRAFGAQERITSVTSFRPKNPLIRDDTHLPTIRPISDLNALYYQFSTYRLEIMEARIRAQLKDIQERRAAGLKFDTKTFKAFLSEQEDFLAHTNKETVPGEDVRVGYIEEHEEAAPPSTASVKSDVSLPPGKRARL